MATSIDAPAIAIALERTHDVALIKRIATDPAIWGHISDDGTLPPDLWQPPDPMVCAYLVARDDGEALGMLLGMFMFVPVNACTVEVHTCMLPSAYGARALKAAMLAAQWIWDNTPAHRIVSNVPAYNRLAARFAFKAGMREWGRNPKSYLRGGVLHDQIWFGMSRGE